MCRSMDEEAKLLLESIDYYQVLQISPKADPAIVKAAYYTHLRTLKKHPDLGGSHEEATILNEAYEVLSDPQRRREYDKKFYRGLVSPASAPEPNPFSPATEMRRTIRAVFQNPFRFRKKRGEWVSAQFRDISWEGACFRTLAKFEKGDAIEIDISDNPILKPTAKICWVRLLPQRFGLPFYEGGLTFKKIDREAYQKYLKLVGLPNLL